MTPIEKNIIVVDEQGTPYEATYPKRAKGLVKNGRARFVDDHTICLACPPDNLRLEDKNMSENKEKLSINYLLEQIEKIAAQTSYLNEAIAGLGRIEEAHIVGDIVSAKKAVAFGDIVKSRETTNQQLIAFYQRLYEDLRPERSLTERKFTLLEQMAQNPSLLGSSENIALVLDSITSLEN